MLADPDARAIGHDAVLVEYDVPQPLSSADLHSQTFDAAGALPSGWAVDSGYTTKLTVSFVDGSGAAARTVASEGLATTYVFGSKGAETLQLEVVDTGTRVSRTYVDYVFNARGARSFASGVGFAIGAAAALDRGTSLTRLVYNDGVDPAGLSPAEQALRQDRIAQRTAELLSELP